MSGYTVDWRDHHAAVVIAYERGLRRGLAIARENEDALFSNAPDVDWDAAEAQMEREIEEAKR